MSEQTSGIGGARSEVIFLCLIGTRWSCTCNDQWLPGKFLQTVYWLITWKNILTRNTKCGSLINAFAYWSSDIQVKIIKHNFTRFSRDSDFISCITRELYKEKASFKTWFICYPLHWSLVIREATYQYSRNVTNKFEGWICWGDIILWASVLLGLVSVLVLAKVVIKFRFRWIAS